MAWTTTEIKAKIKELTGDASLNNASLLVRINHFYQNVLPLEFHLRSLESTVTTAMVSGTTSYAVDPNSCFTMAGPARIDDSLAGSMPSVRFRTDGPQFWIDFPEPTALGTHTMALPTQVLYEKNMMYPRPVPNAAYSLVTEAYVKPTALASGGSCTEEIWGPILAYDVAMDILMDRGDTDPIPGLIEARKAYIANMVSKEIMQLHDQRALGSI